MKRGSGKDGYIPMPLDTARIKLPPEIEPLVEHLARNTHELWSEHRLHDGWSWGPVRNDDRKQHPCLVPYESLPESEREYDRKTAVGAIKAVLALGFRILPPA